MKTADPSTIRQVSNRIYWSRKTYKDGTTVHVCRTRVTDHTGREPVLWDVGSVYVREKDGLLRAEFRGLGSEWSEKDCSSLAQAFDTVLQSLTSRKPTKASASGQARKLQAAYRRGEAWAVFEVPTTAPASPTLPRPDFAAAWSELAPDLQAKIGALVIEHCFYAFASDTFQGDDAGIGIAYLDAEGRDEASLAASDAHAAFDEKVQSALPSLFGDNPSDLHPFGTDPAWATPIHLSPDHASVQIEWAA